MILRLLAAALLCVLMTHAVDARLRLHYRTSLQKMQTSPGLRRVMAGGAGRVVGGRPSGCPRRYCGCGASLYIFGRIVPSLNLAANWLRFPRGIPAPGMVAARRGHVFVLERHIGGSVWQVYDANSGRHRTRVHPRSIAGFGSSILTAQGWSYNERRPLLLALCCIRAGVPD
jgi:hypothetical protein